MATSIENQLANYMRNGIVNKLGVDPSQASIGIKKYIDARWLGCPHYQIVPGSVRPDGRGRGAQEGGSLIRVQRMMVYLYVKLELDQYQMSSQQLINDSVGVMNLFEALRVLFSYTFFGDSEGGNCLLSEPLWFASEGDVIWEDQTVGLVSREFVWEAQYSVADSGPVSLYLDDVVNQVG